MFIFIKTIFMIKLLSWRIKRYDKRFAKITKEADRISKKAYKARMDQSYAKQNIHPEETWDQRAEREFRKTKF